MRLTIALLVLINAYFLNARSVPIVESSSINPCTEEGLYSLKYYHPYSNDVTKYIECNPWNGMEIKSCPEGSKWNQWLSACIIPQVGMDDKATQFQLPENLTMPLVEFCTFFGNFTCQNGGICNQFFAESKCFCLSNFTGEYCQVSGVVSRGAFGQLINETFSLDLYKRQRPLVNDSLSFNTSFDTSLILDEATKLRVQKYLDLYPNGEMRFDTLINYLVQDFLSQLFPSAFFLREFTLESEIEMGYSNAIPNLLQSAKYGYDRFENFFLIFEEVLDNLVEYLPKYLPKVRDEAQTFFEVYDMIFTRFSSMDNSSSSVLEDGVKDRLENRTELTRDEIRLKIWEDFNTTLVYSYDLFRYLNRFDDELSVRGENFTSEEMAWAVGNFSLDAETTRLLSEIHMTSTQMWDSLSFYGFWYVISKYVTLPEIDNSKVGSQQRPFFDAKRPVFSALVGGEDIDGDGEGKNGSSDEGSVQEEAERLISGDSTTVLPVFGQLLAEPTTILPPSVARFLPDTTVLPPLVRKLIALDSTTAIPSVSRLLSEELTTVFPKVEKMIGETTIVPSVARLIGGEPTTVLPRIEKFMGESTTVFPSVEKLMVESTTVFPKVDRLVGGESTTVFPKVDRLMGGESTTVFPSVEKLMVEPTTVFPSVEKLMVESTTVFPSVARLVSGESTTVLPRIEKFMGDSTTAFPSVARLISGESTTVLPKIEKLMVESTTAFPSVARLVGGESTTVFPSVEKLMVEPTTVFPSVERLVSGESTTVLPRIEKFMGESTTIVPSVARLVSGESTTVFPSVEKLMVESTTVFPSVEKLMVESTTVFPSVARLVSSESTTILPKIEKLMVESTTVLPKIEKLMVESTTVLPKIEKLMVESTTVLPPMVRL